MGAASIVRSRSDTPVGDAEWHGLLLSRNVLQRRQPQLLLKAAVEVALIAEAQIRSDMGWRNALCKELFCPVDPAVKLVGVGRDAHLLGKHPKSLQTTDAPSREGSIQTSESKAGVWKFRIDVQKYAYQTPMAHLCHSRKSLPVRSLETVLKNGEATFAGFSAQFQINGSAAISGSDTLYPPRYSCREPEY